MSRYTEFDIKEKRLFVRFESFLSCPLTYDFDKLRQGSTLLALPYINSP